MTSHSPADDELTPDYVRGWLAVNRLVREGASWSGREANCAYLNLGAGAFADVSHLSGIDFADDARACAQVDWDGDGDLDLWVVNRTAPQVRFLRNDSPAHDDFVALRLVATSGHPLAVGATAELRLGERRLLRQVSAGTGYLSQNSAWLHFGTGGAERVDELTVRWPDGTTESIEGVTPGRRYVVTQGQGRAVAVESPRRNVALVPSVPVPLPASEVAQLGLTWRVPFPRLTVTDFAGAEHVLGAPGGPVLVNLWASWCPSCRGELKAWSAERAALEAAGLTVLALSVDDDDAAARHAANELSCWFPTGMAPDALVIAGDVLQSALIDRKRELAVPTSFLLDGEGRVANIYKGPVSVEQLLADVADLPRRGLDAATAALPVAGRWHTGPHFPDVIGIADGLVDRGAPQLAGVYLDMAAGTLGDDAASAVNRRRIATALARQGAWLTDAGELDAAEQALRQALELDDGQAGAHYALGRIALQRGALTDAAASLRRAVALDAELAEGWNLLGVVLDADGDAAGALDALQRAVSLDPELSGAWLALGIHHLTQGHMAESLPAFRRATELAPENSLAWTGLGTCLLDSGERAEGLAALERALELDPKNARARGMLDAAGG